jgi:8-oxo-dGTP pyrophosphatase MutT (NUDIX family)
MKSDKQHGGERIIEETLRARGDWLGASCVAGYHDHGFVLAAAVAERELILSGIGGKVEPGETFRAAALREFEEETGRVPETLVPAETWHLTATARGLPVPSGAAGLIATRPEQHPAGGWLWIAVFLGRLSRPPLPVEKIRHFVVLAPDAFPPRRADGDAVLDCGRLRVFDGDGVRDLHDVLPGVREVRAIDTARAVLADPYALTAWWQLLQDQPRTGSR